MTVDRADGKTDKESTMQAIETRYIGPTDYKGSRIVASSADGHRHVLPYPHELNCDAAHRKAATELAEVMGWLRDGRRIVGAPYRRGWYWVFVDSEGREL